MFVNRFLGNTDNNTVTIKGVFFPPLCFIARRKYFEIGVSFYPGLHLNTIIESIFIKPNPTKLTTLPYLGRILWFRILT